MFKFLHHFRTQINAYLFSFAVTVFGRIAVIAVVLRYWSEERASVWISITAIIYFAMLADAGVTRYFSNLAIISYSGNKLDEACLYFRCARRFAAIAGAIAVAVAAATVILIDVRSLVAGVTVLPRAEVSSFFVCAIASIGLGFVATACQIPLRMHGREATAVFIENLARLMELIVTATIAVAGLGLVAAGIGVVAARLFSILATLHYSPSLQCPRTGDIDLSWRVMRRHWGRASAYLFLPVSDGIMLNLTQVMVGILNGAATLNTFSILRIYSRLIWQCPQILRMSVNNELSRCYGRGDDVAALKILRQITLMSTAGMLAASMLLVFGREKFLTAWLGGAYAIPSLWELIPFLFAAGAAGLALVPSSWLEAKNAFVRYGILKLLFAIIGFSGFLFVLLAGGNTATGMLVLAVADGVLYFALKAVGKRTG